MYYFGLRPLLNRIQLTIKKKMSALEKVVEKVVAGKIEGKERVEGETKEIGFGKKNKKSQHLLRSMNVQEIR